MKANALEVFKNGEPVAVIGITKPGVVGAVVEIRKEGAAKTSVDLHLHALENLSEERAKYTFWNSEALKDGDEIRFRVVHAPAFTPPKSSSVEDRVQQDELKYRQYLSLKKYFSKRKR